MSLDVVIAHNELRHAAAHLVEKSLALGSLVMRYVALFRPAKNRMSADRWAKLILQLQPDLQRNAVDHKGRTWPVPLESWKRGLEAVLERAAAGKITLPLENHNYLYAVLVGMADTAQAEAVVEDSRRHQAAPAASAGPVSVGAALARTSGVPDHVRALSESLKQGLPTREVRS